MIEDLDVFFNDFSVSVTFGATTISGILDTPDDIIGGGVAVSTEYALTVKSADISSLEELDILAVEGVSFKIRSIRKLSDGALSIVTLSMVPS